MSNKWDDSVINIPFLEKLVQKNIFDQLVARIEFNMRVLLNLSNKYERIKEIPLSLEKLC